MKERVGAALSLDKFATAKVSKYDKRKVIEKQRALKAKQFNKYKRLKQRLEAPAAPLDYTPYDPTQDSQPIQAKGQEEQHEDPQQQQRHPQLQNTHKRGRHNERQAAVDEHAQQQEQQDEAADHEHHKQPHKKHKHHKPPSQLQRLADRTAADKAAKGHEKQQREQALAEKQRQLEQKKKQRSHQKHDFFKKTKRGQPVMKVRVDKILAQLEKEKGIRG